MTLPNEDGVYPGLDREAYDRIARVNWSTLKHMQRSPFHYRSATQRQFKDTDPMRIGRATHAYSLEPETFLARWAVWEGKRRDGKEWEGFLAKAAGLEVLTAKQYQQVKDMASAALTSEHAGRYLRGGATEVTVLWTHKATGVQCKSRLDHAATAVRAIVDLKTTADASPAGFARLSWNLDYRGQAAFYDDAWEAVTGERHPYIIVAVESAAPHAVQAYSLPEHVLAPGRAMYQGLLERLVVCRKENWWPAYAAGVLELETPPWAGQDAEASEAMGEQQ